MAAILAPTDAAGGVEVLADEVAALLEMVDSFDAVTPPDLVTEDLGFLDVDPFLSNYMLPHFQHGHRILVGIGRVEVIRRRFFELCYSLLPHHLSFSLASSLPSASSIMFAATVAVAALAVGANAAPTKVYGNAPRAVNGLAIPESDFTVPIVGAVPRSARKTRQLQEQIERIQALRAPGSDFSARWVGDGSSYEFFGPGSGVEYAVNVTVAGQNVSVIFDTGSSDLWFPANNFTCIDVNGTMIAQADCNFGPTYFDIETASAAGYIVPVNFANNFNISYGDGETALGSAYIGPVGFAGITVNNTEFSVVEESYWEGDGVTDGLIGFANPLITSVFYGTDGTIDSLNNSAEYDPWFYQANADGLVAPYFSIALNRATVAQEFSDDGEAVLQNLGSVTLGGMPSNSSVPCNGVSVTVPNEEFTLEVDGQNVTAPAYYTINVTSWNFNGSDSIETNSPLTILDSGTTLVYAPNAVADLFNSQFQPAGYYNETAGGFIVDCNAQAPSLSVTIGGVEFPFTQADLVYAQGPGNNTCISSLVRGGNTTEAIYILGDRFLVNNVVTFNIQTDEITLNQRVPY